MAGELVPSQVRNGCIAVYGQGRLNLWDFACAITLGKLAFLTQGGRCLPLVDTNLMRSSAKNDWFRRWYLVYWTYIVP